MRSCWENCAGEIDREIVAIDSMEDSIAPLDKETVRIRRLVTSLELCHHKAERWVALIIEGIGSGKGIKGPVGTRPAGQTHPIEEVWGNCCKILSSWTRAKEPEPKVGVMEGKDLVACLGPRTPLKVWQVERVVEKISSVLDPSNKYQEIVENDRHYRGDSDFRDVTLETVIHDTVDGEEAMISLAAAIDHLEPCHWNFIENLVIVLAAIGGDLYPEKPFGACHRNIRLTPILERMRIVTNTLQTFIGEQRKGEIDEDILEVLGSKTPVKEWLVESRDKTIRLQLAL